MATATKAQLDLIYRRTHNDYKGVSADGVRMILVCRGATCLVPLDDLTPEEVAQRLPKPKGN
ncbi:TPA: hypothetical protein ACRNDU_006619 [Pseudomonas aeruginosa]|jgi:hypothetical protein|uniref:hypothetical protein n=1 Tax=Pseudomonas TaxID=286 RepID=UPI0011B6A075|nr:MULTISPECIES: hypothetical protein [Pseudomonas]MCE0946157.1 hypothetical protein [Pseudomonas asiatica]MCE1004769.1 hypothetical protein [Pseudomonas sp. NMI1173_11]MCE1066994.1 hypothetical protein [Pseudomonas asiatica]